MNEPSHSITRTPVHTRAVTYRGFSRSDGLWDIECRLLDTKDSRITRFDGIEMPAGTPAHDMLICMTVDDGLKIVEIQSDMPTTPFDECPAAMEPLRRLIGVTLGRGWRKAIDAAMGGEGGCTHLRELLFNLATAAMQTVPPRLQQLRRERGLAPLADALMPHFVGQCMSWRRDGPIVQRVFPQFFLARVPADPGPATEPGP